MNKPVSKAILQRLPAYLGYLRTLPAQTENISATGIAAALSMGEVQVRKDLALVSGAGRPRLGYPVQALREDLEHFLGCDDVVHAVVIGAGKLGRALLDYNGFESFGVKIVAAFDNNEKTLGETKTGKMVFPMAKFPDLCKRLKVHIALLTVPADCAQEVCNELTENGILAIMNFAPVHLQVPENVLVQNENIAPALAVLSRHLAEQLAHMI